MLVPARRKWVDSAKSGNGGADRRVSIQGADTVNNPLTITSGGSGPDACGSLPQQSTEAPKKGEKEEKKRCSGFLSSAFGGRESGKDLQQNLNLAINASQIFYLVIAAVEPLLPQIYLEFVLPLAFFSLDLSLVFPSLDPQELKWYQLLCDVSLTVVCCWFLLYADKGEDGYNEDKQHDWVLQLLP